MSKLITITVDGRKIETENRRMLLEILTEQGIYVPTLCHHPSLDPSGSCRLCVVEICKEEWQGTSRIVTSCLYPAEEGLIVSTRSAGVLETRRTLLELYLAHCPESEQISELARLEGIDKTTYALHDQAEKCIICGLCTRVCQDLGPGAISTLNRGIAKEIGSDLSGSAESCTGCRTCAVLCPTGAIPMEQHDQRLRIWNREFTIPICSVEPERCRGCGVCEEVCPFSIPRVTLDTEGRPTARISPTTCVGCGICAGACPTGAIYQKEDTALSSLPTDLDKRDLKGKYVVFACSRSPLPNSADELIRVSCIGRVSIEMLLYCLAAGAAGVGMMCRDRLTCPYKQGGDLGEERTFIAGQLAEYCGLNAERLALLKPYPGQTGPELVWSNYKDQVGILTSELSAVIPQDRLNESGMDLAVIILEWLKEQPGLSMTVPQELITATGSASNFDFAYLPELHLMFKMLLQEPVICELLDSVSRADNLRILDKLMKQEKPFTFKLLPEEQQQLLENHKVTSDLKFASLAEYLQYTLLLRPGAWRFTNAARPVFSLKTAPGKQKEEGDVIQSQQRVQNHPILAPLSAPDAVFSFNGIKIKARKGEALSSALYAAGIHIFGHHDRDGGAQGIYCVNGQCSQCMVIVNGKPVKGCMTPVEEGLEVFSLEGLPVLQDLPPESAVVPKTPEFEVDVLIIGGGPAGISAAIELGNIGINTVIIDDKHELGGKLSLQTHNFFGSVKDCYAGERGIHIGDILTDSLKRLPTVDIWYDSTVVGVFSDGLFGVSGRGSYRLVRAKSVLFSTGAREKSLALPGADLPGVYGAGAFQTLVNRDLVRCADRLFIVGGGNVGLIGAYHALQAGIDVVGLVEALPSCGGYKVHEDKIKRLGVPVWTAHTVLRIEGEEEVERVIIAAVDEQFKPLKGTERSFEVDTVLIAVGLSPVDELLIKAQEYGIKVYAAGDAEEIAEASAAIFSGKITGRKIAQDMGIDIPVPSNWEDFGKMLKHRPGESKPFIPEALDVSVYPLIRCMQEIPCNPCTEACPNSCIAMPGSILALPEFGGECIGCGKCVLACPGLAINLVIEDYDPNKERTLLMMPYEFVNEIIPLDREVTTTDMEGNVVGKGRVVAYRDRAIQNSRRLLLLEVPEEDKLKVAGFMIREIENGTPVTSTEDPLDPIVCRCERVRKSEIVAAIRDGVRDMNQLKAVVRTGLGGCNGKTCTDLILRIFREEGVSLNEIIMPTHRPLVAEVHLGDFIADQTEGSP
ncbi:MAG: 4Fe-4S dicluster domain-containing protein [Firmicutes bacterium]|nr:4Fe-4S dicluster domain-containing protein [Bacillota bacterium]